MRVCRASRFHVDFDAWRLRVLREANFRTFGSSAAPALPCSLHLLNILVLKEVDTQTPKAVKLVSFLPTFQVAYKKKELRERKEGRKRKLFTFFS